MKPSDYEYCEKLNHNLVGVAVEQTVGSGRVYGSCMRIGLLRLFPIFLQRRGMQTHLTRHPILSWPSSLRHSYTKLPQQAQ